MVGSKHHYKIMKYYNMISLSIGINVEIDKHCLLFWLKTLVWKEDIVRKNVSTKENNSNIYKANIYRMLLTLSPTKSHFSLNILL